MKENYGKAIQLIILFGSRVSGKAGTSSDADIAVLADHPLSLNEKSVLGEQIARDLHVAEDAIDIVDICNASPLLQHEVALTGKLLAGKSYDFIRFKVLAWKRYLDTAKFRRAREVAMKRYVEGNNS